MQGIFIDYERPKSKKAVKEAVAKLLDYALIQEAEPMTVGAMLKGKTPRPVSVRLEATSVFGNEYDGDILNAPDGTYTFVGPDPYRKRNFYGTIKKSGASIKVS